MVKRTAEHNAKIAKSMKAYHSTCDGVKKADRVVKVKAPKVAKVKAPKVAKKSVIIPKNSGEQAVLNFLNNLTPAQQKDAKEFEKKAKAKKPRSAAQKANDKKLTEPGMKQKAEIGRVKALAKRKREAKRLKLMEGGDSDDEDAIELTQKDYKGKEYFVDEKTGGIWDMEEGQLIGIWKNGKPKLN